MLLYKTLIRPVVSFVEEAWTVTKRDKQAVLDFERKMFRRIYGSKYGKGEWKSRTNRELEYMSKGENVVKWKKRAKNKLVGQLERMEGDRTHEEIFTEELEGSRRRGRPGENGKWK